MEQGTRRLLVFLIVLAILGGLGWVYWNRHFGPGSPSAGMGGGMGAMRAGMPAGPAAAGARSRAGATGGMGGGAPGQMQVSVVTTEARMLPLAIEVEALGTARANEAIDITAKVANTVTVLRFAEGQQVARGQVLLELDTAQARADLAAAEAALKESQSAWDRSQDLFAKKALSQSQLDQIEAALTSNQARVAASRARLADNIIRAPFAGRVGLRRVSVGGLVSPGMVITTLDDDSVMKLDFDVPEAFMAALAPGLDVRASSVAYPGQAFTGKVASVDSRVDPVSRTVKVRAVLPNEERLLKPGMFLMVKLSREPLPALVVPEQAIVPERGKVFVFVVKGGRAERREVATGRRRPGEVEILTGLAAGEQVVVEGTQKVSDGSSVREGAPPAPGPAGGAVAPGQSGRPPR